MRRSRAIARASRSPRSWPGAIRRTPVWQHDLSVSHDRIGDLLDKKGDREAALESFRKSLAIAKALTLRDPDNVQWQWDLSASHDRIGDVADRPGQARRGARRATAAGWRSPRRWSGAIRAMPAGSATWRSATTRSARSRRIEQPRRGARAAGEGSRHHRPPGQIAAHQAQWRSDLSRFDEVLRTLNR